MLYTRLHGGGDDQHEYDYEYSDAELEKVCKRLVRRAETHEKVFCLFNNHQKFQNARSLLQRLPRGT